MIKTISATSLNLYTTCPLQWKFRYIYKLLQPDNPAFIVGTAYHKSLELFHTGGETVDIMEEMKKDLMPNKTKEEIERFAIVRKMFDKYKDFPSEGETQQVEYKFELPLDDLLGEDVKLIGFIDRVTPESIIDYKTTSLDFTEEDCIKNVQTDIYSYVMWKEKGFFPNVTYHIMNKKKVSRDGYEPQIITIKRNEDDMARLEEKIKEFYKNVNDEKFEYNCDTHCFWCPYRYYCNKKK